MNTAKFWTDSAEQEFLMSHLTPNTSMLEYGSGHSTLILQDTVKHLTSVEHHQGWYNQLKPQLKDNVEYLYVPPTNPIWEQQFNPNGTKNPAGDDGSFEDFASLHFSMYRRLISTDSHELTQGTLDPNAIQDN